LDDRGSTQEAIRVVEEAGARVVCCGALIDRSAGKIDLKLTPIGCNCLSPAMRKKIAAVPRRQCSGEAGEPLCSQRVVMPSPGFGMRYFKLTMRTTARISRLADSSGQPQSKAKLSKFCAG